MRIHKSLTLKNNIQLFSLSTKWRCVIVFNKLDKIGNNANIGIRGFTRWKQKIPVTKWYPQ